MPTLSWIGKEKIVNHDKEVPFRLLRKNKRFSLGKSENLIVEGDNLEALKALMPYYLARMGSALPRAFRPRSLHPPLNQWRGRNDSYERIHILLI